jgi:hypothetical protein
MGVTIDNKGRGSEGGGPQDERKMKMKDLDLAKLNNRLKMLV